MRVSSESTLDLPCDGPPKMEPLPAPRATRFLLLQNSELSCSDLAMLIAQTLDNGQYADTATLAPDDRKSTTVYPKGQLLRSIGVSPVRGGQTRALSSHFAVQRSCA